MILTTKKCLIASISAVVLATCVFMPASLKEISFLKAEYTQASRYYSTIKSLAREHGVEAALVAAVIKVESDFNPKSMSHRGAVGLMQVLPSTAREVKVYNIHDPKENIRAGVKYLRALLSQFRGNTRLAVAAYNAGPTIVKRIGAIPPYPETRKYVNKVFHHWKEFKKVL